MHRVVHRPGQLFTSARRANSQQRRAFFCAMSQTNAAAVFAAPRPWWISFFRKNGEILPKAAGLGARYNDRFAPGLAGGRQTGRPHLRGLPRKQLDETPPGKHGGVHVSIRLSLKQARGRKSVLGRVASPWRPDRPSSGGGFRRSLGFGGGLFAFDVRDAALAFDDFVILLAHNALLLSQLNVNREYEVLAAIIQYLFVGGGRGDRRRLRFQPSQREQGICHVERLSGGARGRFVAGAGRARSRPRFIWRRTRC